MNVCHEFFIKFKHLLNKMLVATIKAIGEMGWKFNYLNVEVIGQKPSWISVLRSMEYFDIGARTKNV